MSDQDLIAAIQRKLPQMKVDHESLSGPSVVSASTSHELQNKAPEMKPVVKGTKAEVLRMKINGEIGPQKVVFTDGKDAAYIIDANAVHAIYGGTIAQAVTQAKKDLKNGGNMESLLLGYPDRDGIDPESMQDVAVDRDGNVITDLGDMKNAAESQNVIWAAQGKPEDVTAQAEKVSKRWKEIGNEDTAEEGNGQGDGNTKRSEGSEAGEMPQGQVTDDPQQGEAAQVTGGNLKPSVLINGQQLTGGDTHNEILDAHSMDRDEGQRGFQLPSGKWASRAGAMAWLKQNQPDVFNKLRQMGVKELHSEDLMKAYA